MVGVGPNVGQLSIIDYGFGTGGGAGSGGLDAHIHDPSGAHPAFAISIDGHPDLIGSGNVEGAIDELMGAIATPPPRLGEFRQGMQFPGGPDWGTLKLEDSSILREISGLTLPLHYPNRVNSAEDIYPYYFQAATPTQDWAALLTTEAIPNDTVTLGADFVTDPLWNVAAVVGGGEGLTHSGAFTDESVSVGGAFPLVRTSRIVPLMPPTSVMSIGAAGHFLTCVSGCLFPADRGVVALIHWPHGGDTAAFLAQPLLSRCVAALLCGAGLQEGVCYTFADGTKPADGDSGGIFGTGVDANGDYDPFAYPGRASGQYNLNEIFLGTSSLDASTLPAPWDDLDGDGIAGAARQAGALIPGAGQVRLGTDPTAGTVVAPYGIPIFGASADGYSNPALLPLVDGGYPSLGSSLVLPTNFFSYRLPYLADYRADTGMKYTPRGIDPYATKEVARYLIPEATFDTASSAVFQYTPGVYRLNLGGAYYPGGATHPHGFEQDYWIWQIARYRHSFYIENSDAAGAMGTYWLLHFKTETDFEKLVRDGIMPWDLADGYELYGAAPAQPLMEDYGNVVNEETTGATPPLGPAPDYGYAATSYWANRESVFVADFDVHDDVDFSTHEYTWTVPGLDPGILWTSGIAYFTPKTLVGATSFQITDLAAVALAVTNPWTQGYRTDDNPLTGSPQTDPAVISSPEPVLLYLGVFAYDTDPITGDPTYTVTDPAFTDARGVRVQRIEFPFNHLGTHGGFPFSETNGPTSTDDLTVDLNGAIQFAGDQNSPAFSVDAMPRVFSRRPLAHTSWALSAQPYNGFPATGIHGTALEEVGGADILYHSTAFDVVGLLGHYGNFTDPLSAPANQAYVELTTADKDIQERFLDEVYRYSSTWFGMGPLVAPLTGPGMLGWMGGPIAVPVRAGTSVAGGFDVPSWTRLQAHLLDLATVVGVTTELQVTGLPHRNPPLSDWVKYPFPSSGILQYPKTDYSAGVKPDAVELGFAQYDYSISVNDRVYVRAFDAAFSAGSEPVITAGQPFMTFRIDGLILEEFAYQAPGPGNMTTGLAVMIKVPGLTTWMDAGRVDGGGPAKQDPILDGAGCLVLGPNTFSSIDTETGVVYSQVRLNVGPVANLALGVGAEVPVLIKVLMRDPAVSGTATDFDFNHEADALVPGTFTGATGPGIRSWLVRGIVGLSVVHPNHLETAPSVPVVPVP